MGYHNEKKVKRKKKKRHIIVIRIFTDFFNNYDMLNEDQETS